MICPVCSDYFENKKGNFKQSLVDNKLVRVCIKCYEAAKVNTHEI